MRKAKEKALGESSSQGTISAYFTTNSSPKCRSRKRPSSPIDLTGDDDQLVPPVKKAKALTPTSPATGLSNAEAGPSRIQSRAAVQWRYYRSSSPPLVSEQATLPTPAQDSARR